MQSVGELLNLKEHTFTPRNTQLYGPIDIEVHKGKDGRYNTLLLFKVRANTSPCLH